MFTIVQVPASVTRETDHTLVFISNVLDTSVVVLTTQKGPFSEVLMQYSEKFEGQLLKILFYICLNLSVYAYLVCYMHSNRPL